MSLYKIQKTVLSIRNNPARFLSGITSNDLDKPDNAFLNIYGRIVATFDQAKVDEDKFYILIEKSYVEKVFEHLDRYIRLSRVVIDEVDINIYFDLDGTTGVSSEDVVIPQKKGRIIVTELELETNVSEDEFTLFRLKNDIPRHGIDYTDEMLLNVSTEHFISFAKGCFLGQEPISKVHNRSKPTWRLKVKYVDDCDEDEKKKMTSMMFDDETNRSLGFVFEKNN